MKTGIVTTDTYLNHNTGQGHPENADRVSVVIENLKKIKNKNFVWKKPNKFDAKYLKMTSFMMPKFAPGQRQSWLPWPYVESITIDEAKNALAMLAVGMHGEPLPPQNGAPLRLILPWKYGFKSIKSIQKFTFVAERPTGFWQELAGTEYGFWANVNPDIPHPRWSQKTEKELGTNLVVPTQLYNGYASFVAPLYKHLEHENLYV